MALAQLALTIYLAADVGPRASAGTVGIVILVAIATLELAVMIAFSRIGRPHDPGDDDQDDDDPGWGRDGPRTPPPDAPPVSWPEFEREFAEYVAARSRTRRDVRPERKVASAQARKQAAPADVFQLAAARSSIEPSDGTT